MKFQIEKLKEKMEHDAMTAEQARIDRHDTRHKFQTAAYLLENGKVSEAYLGQAKKAGIVLETRLSFPDTLPVDSGEFSVVIANALENAIKACCSLPEEQRVIICKCIYKPGLMFEISNPCQDGIVFSKEGIPLSDEKEHGIGTRSMIAFCKKYGALCSFSLEEGWFTLKIVL